MHLERMESKERGMKELLDTLQHQLLGFIETVKVAKLIGFIEEVQSVQRNAYIFQLFITAL